MQSNISFALNWLLITSCKGVVAILLVLLLRKTLAHRITPQGRYLLWIPVIVCFLMPFGWQVPYPSFKSGNAYQTTSILLESERIYSQPASADLGDKEAVASTHAGNTGKTSIISAERIKEGFLILWFAGVLTLFSIVIRNTVGYARIRAGAQQVQGPVLDLFNDCKTTIGIDRTIELRQSSAVSSPIVTGWRHPVVLLPQHFDQQLSRSEIRHVLLHELNHVKRLDLPMSWPMTVVQILNWFNPLVWYMGREFRTDMEAACDANVLSALHDNDRIAYGHTLIKLSEPPVTGTLIECGAGIMERYSQLKARIKMINQFNPPNCRRNALAVLALSMIIPLTCLQPLAVAAPSTVKQSSTTSPVIAEVSTVQISTSNNSSASPSASQRSTEEKPVRSTPQKSASTVGDQNNTEDMQSLYLKVEHANAANLAAFVRPATGLSLLSNHGSIAVDARTNSLLVHDMKENIDAVKELVAHLDVALKKVMIEARMVVVDNDAAIELIARARRGDATKNHQPEELEPRPFVAMLGRDYDTNKEIVKLQKEHRGELVSSPKILTEIRKEAIVEQGILVPGQVNKNFNNSSPTRLLVNLKMQPDITPENRIHLFLSLSRQSLAPSSKEPDARDKSIDDKIQIVTDEFIHDGQTIVLADNFEPLTANGDDIRTDKLATNGKRLIIFVTPKIMNEDGSSKL